MAWRRQCEAALAAAVFAGGCQHDIGGITAANGYLSAAAGSLDFGTVALQQSAVRRVSVTNTGQASLQIMSLQLGGPDQDQFQLSPAAGGVLQSGDSAELVLTLTPTRVGPVSAEVDLVGADPSSQAMTIALAGQALNPQIALSPTSLAFGTVEIGDPQTLQLSATNSSPLPARVVLAAEGPDAAAVSLQPAVVELGAGQSQSVSVTWAPTQAQALAAWLTALPCSLCQAERIDLTGTGIPTELIAVPSALDFGAIPKDFSVEKTVALENVSDHDLQLLTVGLGAGSSGDFALGPPTPLPFTLVAGAAYPVSVSYLTTSLQPATGNLDVTSTDLGHPHLQVPLSGNVGGGLLALAPAAIDFGVVPLGAQPTIQLLLENQGSGANLTVTSATLAGPAQFTIDATQLPVTLAPQQTVSLPVSFQPTSTAALTATLTVQSNDPVLPVATVAVAGSGRDTLPCQLQLQPVAVDFGSVPPGSGAVLAFHAVDVGPDVCVFRHIQIDPSSDPGFFLPGGDVNSFVINPGEFAQAQVAFQPAQPGPASGDVAFTLNAPAQPQQALPLTGNAQAPCLSAVPPWLDFGPVQPGCGAPLNLTTQLTNGCAAPVTVSKVWIGPGTTTDFSISAAPATPLVVPPGASVSVAIQYQPTQQGMQADPLFCAEDDVPRPALVPLLGELLPPGARTDQFVQQSAQLEDVLFVMANTGSMRTKIQAVLAGLPSFADALAATALDYHVGVTTTGLQPGPDPLWPCPGGAAGGEDGRLFPVDGSLPRILDRALGSLATALNQNMQVGFCHYYQQGLQAFDLALTPPLSTSAKAPGTPEANDGNLGFLRNDASLAIIAVSDDDDYSVLPEADYLQTLRALSGYGTQRRVSFSALVDMSGCPQDTRIGQRYLDIARATGGVTADLCAASLDAAFAALAQQASGLQTSFPLSANPQPATIAVTVNGTAVGGWSYDAAVNAVVFPAGSEPPADSQIDVTYVAQCQ